MEKALIQLTNVELRQEGHTVLRNVHLNVRPGEMVYIMGEVGSGKSSLLKSLYGELPIANGEATVLGTNMTRVKPRQLQPLRRQIGIIFQDFQLLKDRTVSRNLDFVLRATGWRKNNERTKRITQVLQTVGLADKSEAMPHELSGGEQQCVCIARAMLNKPQLLLADEPTANLHEAAATRVINLLNSLREQGTAIVLSTHNNTLPEQCPGRIAKCQEHTIEEQ